METKHAPGPIQRDGTFLWQLDGHPTAPCNLWSGSISANNGYSREYAEKAATLFSAAEALLKAAKAVAYSNGFDAALPDKMEALRAAIVLAQPPKE